MSPSDTRTFEHTTDEADEEPIPRGSTGLRVLLSLLFAAIWSVAETALAVVVVFSLLWALITQQPPPRPLREFANRLVAYAYRIWRYLTYAEPQVPFPFSSFPESVEGTRDLDGDTHHEVRELMARRSDAYDDRDDRDDRGGVEDRDDRD